MLCLCLVLSRSVAVGSQWWALWPRCFVSKSRSVIGTPVVTSRTIVSDLHCAQSIVRPKRQQIEKAYREILGFNWWSGVAYSRQARCGPSEADHWRLCLCRVYCEIIVPARLVSLMRITTVAATGLFSRFLRRAGQPPSSARIEKAPLNKHSAELVILPRRGLVESVAFLSNLNRWDYCGSFLLQLFLPSRLSRNYHYPQTVRGRVSICHGIEKISVSPQGCTFLIPDINVN